MGNPRPYPYRSRETLDQMGQSLHNLKMRVADDEADRKRMTLEQELEWYKSNGLEVKGGVK
jgi:hypothetical protein